ncbi:MAG: hypothetical protein ACXW1P_07315 [Methylophilaceae bacterium]
MTYLLDIWHFFRTWGSVVGLAFDIAGACLVYLGVRTTLAEALTLEAQIIPMSIDDIGNENLSEKVSEISHLRAKERLRAKYWALVGLVCFLLGFLLQAFGSWPK